MKKLPIFFTNDNALQRGEKPKITWLECKKYEEREAESSSKKQDHQPTKTNFHYAKKYQKKEDELMNETMDVDYGQPDDDDEQDWVDLPEGLSDKDMLDVYAQYPPKNNYDQKLPIIAHKNKIMEAIKRTKVVLIEGGTGTGKSTQVAQFIYEDSFNLNKYCNIVITQPRKIAAISLARRVCNENNWKLGSVCGYQVGMDKMAEEDCRMLYCTTGVLLQLLISCKKMNKFTHVILDEIHERSQEMDFCMLVVRKFLRTVSPHVKVILMSATMDSDNYLEYFKYKDYNGAIQLPQHIHVKAGSYHVDEVYLDSLQHLGEIPRGQSLDEPVLCEQLLQISLSLILSFDDPSMGESKSDRGSVLVFMPGYEQIISLHNKLKKYTQSHKLVIHILHSLISATEQISVFTPVTKGYRKVILSTNIAESSITVADIKYVIDFCLTKTILCDLNTSHTSLQLQWASKSSCTQRKGRAGRVANGIVFRLVHPYFYDELPQFDTPEILRCSLEQLVLKAKLLEMGKPKAILALLLSPPDLGKIKSTVFLLKEQGALDPRSRDSSDGALTFMGRVMGSLPLDTRFTRLILLGHVFGLLDEAVIIAALLSLPSIFVFSPALKLNSYIMKLKWARDSQSDCLASFMAYLSWKHLDNREAFETYKHMLTWCKDSFLDPKRLREVSMLVEDLLKRLSHMGIKPTSEHRPIDLKLPHNELLMKVLISGAAYPNFFEYASYELKDKTKRMCGFNHLNTVLVSGLPDGAGRYYKRDLLRTFNKLLSNNSFIKLHFLNTKCFVEFPNDVDSDKSMAVNAAIKMRMLREEITVHYENLYDDENDEDLMRRAPPKPENILSQSSLPPDDVSRILINITHIVNCACFYATLSEHLAKKWELYDQIQQWVAANQNARMQTPRYGMNCLAMYSGDDDRAYYRAFIEKLRPNNNALVFFIDYGNHSIVHLNDLKPLPARFIGYAPQASRFKLINVGPKGRRGGEWNEEENAAFKHLININELYYADIFSEEGNTLRVELFEKNDSMPGASINKQLVRMGVAERVPESNVSQNRHRERQEKAMVALRRKQKQERSQNQRGAIVVRNEETPFDITHHPFLRTIKLSGPENPFEMTFTPIGNLNLPQLVNIDPQSVNSTHVAKDLSQGSPLMVSMLLSLNSNHNRLLLRDSNVFPVIPSLSTLLLVLFCPFAEYRLSYDKRRVTGVLCGMGGGDLCEGGNEVQNYYSTNDIEAEFDVVVDAEDMQLINEVRMAIDLVIGSRMNWSVANLLQIQEENRSKIAKLVSKERKEMQRQSFHQPYRWGKLEDQDCQSALNYSDSLDSSTIFFPHKKVFLQKPSAVKSESRSKNYNDIHKDKDERKNAPKVNKGRPACRS